MVEELKEIAEEEFYFKEITTEYDALIAKLESNKKDDSNPKMHLVNAKSIKT